MQAQRKYEEFLAEAAVINDLGKAAALLSWDQDTYMPEGGSQGRGHQMATLDSIRHARLTSARMADLLSALEAAELPADGVEAATVREARRAYERATRLPSRLVEELARQSSSARLAWVRAREADDFGLFEPELARMVELKREEADAVGFETERYDALLDEYEPGATVAEVRRIFGRLREEQVALLAEIGDSSVKLSDAPLLLGFPPAEQAAYVASLAAAVGYDFGRGRLDETIHPFAESMGLNDVRITTRYDHGNLATALFGTLHEVGHALYEQGIDPAFSRTPLAHAAGLGVHESQSRLWENLVGRSLAFWQGSYPKLQSAFEPRLRDVPLAAFHQAINVARPSLVRIEADEVSYNLHILVRFELETALLDGDLAVKDLPAAWNDRYRDYLGVVPTSDLQGCLQDIHWSVGLFGYFPTYALGNLMSVQLFEAAERHVGDLEGAIRAGDFAPLLSWLRKNVHRHGNRYSPAELLERATGARLDAGPYLDYLRAKFGGLYQLSPARTGA
ncbi:MAG: carboxypeptidase M32 [Trueperaceae bacterium]